MLETTVHLGQAPASVTLIDPNAALTVTASGDTSRQRELIETNKSATELARLNQERERIAQLVEQLSDAAEQLREQRHGLLQEMQQVAVELAIAVASQAIYTKIQAGDFPIEAMVQEAAKRLEGAGPILIRLHPDDLAMLDKRLQGDRGNFAGAAIRFEADSSMNRGDCRADASELGVWCKMQSQIEQMRECVLECIGDAEIERRKNSASDSGLRRFPDRRQTA